VSQFEFIFILVSIILGLALANLFGGISKLSRKSWNQLDGIHLVFSFITILMVFVVWWGMYRWQDHSHFQFETFVVIGLYTSVFYTLSVILFPHDGSIVDFDGARKSYYLALIIMLFLELAHYSVGKFEPPGYYGYVWGFAFLLLAAAIWARQRWLDGLVAAFMFLLYSGWWVVTKF
jgi:cation transport ATPase